jgi:hypothetical protein
MFWLMPLLAAVVAGLIFGGFYHWARRQGLLTTESAAEGQQRRRSISLLTEVVAYVGAILILAGGAVAIGQRWHGISHWGHVAAFAGATAFFLLIGFILLRDSEPAIQRLVGVVWFLSAAGVAGTAGFAAGEVLGSSARTTLLAVGAAVTLYSAGLWLVRRRALQNAALFAGLVVTICGTIVTVAGGRAPSLAFALALWVSGLAWAGLGWQRFVEPIWVTIPCGFVLALIAPSLAAGDHGWAYAIGVVTAAAAMAVSVPPRNTPLLALGTLAMFGYITSVVARYFHESLGVPAALAITGVLIIGLAVVTARLMRATRPPKPADKRTEGSSDATRPPEPTQPGAGTASREGLPRAS